MEDCEPMSPSSLINGGGQCAIYHYSVIMLTTVLYNSITYKEWMWSLRNMTFVSMTSREASHRSFVGNGTSVD